MRLNHVELRAGELSAVVGDNTGAGDHREGYNGLWSLSSVHQPENLFVPAYAGTNLEHIMDGVDLAGANRLFEPRAAPMSVRRISERAAELHQPPTPHTGVESRTLFRLEPPYYIDFEFRFHATKDVFGRGFAGFFWASYIDAPEDKTIHFRGRVRPGWTARDWPQLHEERWIEFRPAFQSDAATACWQADDPVLTQAPPCRPVLYASYSHLAFTSGFYYGISRGMCFQYMFDRCAGIRFTNGVTGAGEANPAWDYQWIVRPIARGPEYALRMRAVYKPFVGREDCLNEYRKWLASQACCT